MGAGQCSPEPHSPLQGLSTSQSCSGRLRAGWGPCPSLCNRFPGVFAARRAPTGEGDVMFFRARNSDLPLACSNTQPAPPQLAHLAGHEPSCGPFPSPCEPEVSPSDELTRPGPWPHAVPALAFLSPNIIPPAGQRGGEGQCSHSTQAQHQPGAGAALRMLGFILAAGESSGEAGFSPSTAGFGFFFPTK